MILIQIYKAGISMWMHYGFSRASKAQVYSHGDRDTDSLLKHFLPQQSQFVHTTT